MTIVINNEIKPLKLLTRDFINSFLKTYILEKASLLNKHCELTETSVNKSAVFYTAGITDGEQILTKVSNGSFSKLNDFIKKELDDDPKNYYRDLFLFESEVKVDRLILRWK